MNNANQNREPEPESELNESLMNMLDIFAAHALTGLLSDPIAARHSSKAIAAESYDMAEAMMLERDGRHEEYAEKIKRKTQNKKQ